MFTTISVVIICHHVHFFSLLSGRFDRDFLGGQKVRESENKKKGKTLLVFAGWLCVGTPLMFNYAISNSVLALTSCLH